VNDTTSFEERRPQTLLLRTHHRSIDFVPDAGTASRSRKVVRNLVRIVSSFAIVAISSGALLSVDARGADAATSLTEPSSSPVAVPADGAGKPMAITVKATGFTPNESVFIEQCDGKPAAAPDWQAALDCDLGSAPAAAIVGADGSVTFLRTDRNHAFTPFAGPSPELLFNCLSANAASPKNAVHDFRNCQLRVSTNNTTETADQQFATLTLPTGPGAAAGSADSGGDDFPIVLVVRFGTVIVAGLAIFLVRRRRAQRSAA